MVNLVTYKSYVKITGRSMDSIISVNEYFDIRTSLRISSLPHSDVLQLISKIEGIPLSNVKRATGSEGFAFISKFTDHPVLIDMLSTSCKAALNVLFYTEVVVADNRNKMFYVDITECGPVALECCLNLLNDVPNLTGIIGATLFITGNNTRELPFRVHLRYGNLKVCESNMWADINDCLWEESLHAQDCF